MAETSDDIRNDIALTRQRMTDALSRLEHKVNPRHVIDDHPLILLGAAVGTGFLLGRSTVDRRAVATFKGAAADATRNTSTAIDGFLAAIGTAVTSALTS